MAGDRGVDDAGVEAGGGEGALHRAVIAAGLLDGDDEVAEVVRRRSARSRWAMAASNPERVCSTTVRGMRTRP